MAEKPVQVEVLDQDGRPVLPAKRETKGTLLTLPINVLIFICAMAAAFGILLVAIGQALQERAKGLGHDDDSE